MAQLKTWIGVALGAGLLAAGVFALTRSIEDDAKGETIVADVVAPYVEMNVAGDHAAARERFGSAAWKAKHTVEDIAASYRTAAETHGGVTGFKAIGTDTQFAIGERDTYVVTGHLLMRDGEVNPVRFDLIQEQDNGPWLILHSWTKGPLGHPGPW